jgi:hypothetical protein
MGNTRTDPNCKVRVKSLKPEYIRERHLGPVTILQTKAKIEQTAALMRSQSPRKKAQEQGRGN